MVNITASDVAKLRRQTGAGMMDCKKALQETNGDFEKAIEYLRKKGAKVAAKRADKDATEGYVVALTNSANDFGVMVMVNCETDFVGKSGEFVSFVNGIADAALQHKAETLQETLALKIGDSTVEQKLNDMIGKTGEKMEFDTYAAINAATVAAYNHIGNKIGTLVGLNKNVEGAAEAGHDIAMQIAAMNPVAIDKDFVSDEVIQKELEIGKELARQEGKPEAMLEKISQGRLVKFFKENTLLNQEYIKDSKLSVRDYLQKTDKDLVVTKFYRFALG
ncbi:MAG: translation elongation factor Ts [Bacteroidales bacterium]|jgi:elongation factor Ts|nr:translation elongation factor Ts [Bacteroidales bacterium]MDD4740972.1 translation elongation factor Ts [Bacteroidales bacterium]MDY0335754.1 translation elongation factor Ts [Bacteroidales bacterium]NCU34911.1 elongation factor Ts [Candidatus Falkowbacteria bacterium]